ncbi:rhodanese-like domain-containing protein [Aquisalibacillus elongatus]|uniref:Rhodanese-related sulfurtransferase n=1 Tax=Aquisalibacillus elongatus TaxID=485577 RepID=A0A3N5B0Q8_9BACI|nr:rhodanese-like domain-containing protein [Aquisalibacillus elongatus]RPF51156.1 rhodanese-related sulfurtransferase [Aquisalibacillus elongatus]
MKSIDAKTVAEKLENGKELNIIDVRETDEVAEGKIPGAKNIPLGLIEFRENELDQGKEYIMVCRSGGRSGKATQYLEGRGFDVTNMTGGMLDWVGPVEK